MSAVLICTFLLRAGMQNVQNPAQAVDSRSNPSAVVPFTSTNSSGFYSLLLKGPTCRTRTRHYAPTICLKHVAKHFPNKTHRIRTYPIKIEKLMKNIITWHVIYCTKNEKGRLKKTGTYLFQKVPRGLLF